jgi:hypothetical protein
MDDLEASGGSRSQAVPLLHSWKPVAKYGLLLPMQLDIPLVVPRPHRRTAPFAC